jgi:ABC-2 type transport system permease protein
MKFMELAKRNFKEMYRDPLSIGLAIGMPVGLLLILQTIGRLSSFFTATMLAPGITLFGFAMITLSSGMILARDRENAFLSRLLTAPLRAKDFISAYSLPFIPLAVVQVAVVFAIGALLGLEVSGNIGLVFLILFIMSIGYIGLGMILGSLFSWKQLPGVWTAVMLLTIFGGTWVDLDAIGGVLQGIMRALPFSHALDAARDVIVQGVGFGSIAIDFLWVLGYTIVFFAAGVFLFRRRMAECT